MKRPKIQQPEPAISAWSLSLNDILSRVDSDLQGLSDSKAAKRRKETPTTPPSPPLVLDALLLIKQFKSPLILILIMAVILASVLGEYANTFIILGIILLSGAMGFWQERKANRALQKLQAIVQIKTTVMRENSAKEIPAPDVVRGDIVLLHAGDIIPGDAILVDANDLHVNEATLTGESFPSEKGPCILPEDTPLARRKNMVFQGSTVVNGTAKAVVVATGTRSELGKISAQLEKHIPETAFEKGIRKFGNMLMTVTVILSLLILLVNISLGKPVTDSILFGTALAVGMAPELLPAILTITLAAGARRMASRKVIVKKLSSLQNLGSVNIFCCDKTGTLTEGIVKVQHTVDGANNHWDKVRTFAFLNATYETGFTNPLDEALRNIQDIDIDGYEKLDEVPYDFIRKRLSIVVGFQGRHLLITKGAVKNILDVCDRAAFVSGEETELEQARARIMKTFNDYSLAGFRTIGLCFKDITGDPVVTKDDEQRMTFLGLVVLSDSLKPGITQVVHELRQYKVWLKIVTGDNALVASHVGSRLGLNDKAVMTGSDLRTVTDEALAVRVNESDIFAEIEPDQKERIVRAFQKAGNVVGYIGDGINDVTALKIADVGISVDTAVDVAKETADIILLEKDLGVLKGGILEGRKTFLNTLKYVFITTSANFGNMFSIAGASLFLPFLPMLPKQILLLNFLTDLPAMAISSDRVDEESLVRPRKWDARLIRNFMIVFGIESSVFDFIAFSLLFYYFNASATVFQTGWFFESAITELLILMVMRTQRPFLTSRPGKDLTTAALLVAVLTIAGISLPFGSLLGFTTLPWTILFGMAAIIVLYTAVAESTKKYFFRKMRF